MDRTLPPAVTGFGKLHAGVFAPASIEQVETPVRECGPYQSGKGVNNAAELVLHSGPFRKSTLRHLPANVYYTLV